MQRLIIGNFDVFRDYNAMPRTTANTAMKIRHSKSSPCFSAYLSLEPATSQVAVRPAESVTPREKESREEQNMTRKSSILIKEILKETVQFYE